MKSEALRVSVDELRRMFPRKSRSWVARSLRRFLNGDVKKISENTWLVMGRREMGDALPHYVVRYINNRYVCDCQASMGKGRVCSHIGAVVLSNIYDSMTKTVYAAVINTRCRDSQLLIIGDKAHEINVRNAANDAGTIYILIASSELSVKALLACDDELREEVLRLRPMELWEVLTFERGVAKIRKG